MARARPLCYAHTGTGVEGNAPVTSDDLTPLMRDSVQEIRATNHVLNMTIGWEANAQVLSLS